MLARETRKRFASGSSGECLVQALIERSIDFHFLPVSEISDSRLQRRTIVAFNINGAPYYFDGVCLRVADSRRSKVPGPIVDGKVARFIKRKDVVKSYLRDHGFNVSKGAAFSSDAASEAEAFFNSLASALRGRICIKPANAKERHRLHTEICDASTFRAAFTAAGEDHEQLLVEEIVPGDVYRFLCLAGRVIAVELGRPSNVEGDGIHTIEELVSLKQTERSLNPIYAKHFLQLGERERAFLKQAGLGPDHVPEPGKTVFLDDSFDLRQGGEFVDVTESVHASYVELVERATKLIKGLVLCGVDVAIQDPGLPATNDNYCFLDLNCGPRLSTHHRPWRGQSRDVAGEIIDYLRSSANVASTRQDCASKAAPSPSSSTTGSRNSRSDSSPKAAAAPQPPLLWSAEDLRAAVTGEWLTPPGPQWRATGITYVPSRVGEGDIVIATDSAGWQLRQEVTDSLDHFYKRGAVCVVVSRRPSSLSPDKPVLLVRDTRQALDDIGRAGRSRLKQTRIAGITGSAGKTTTKEFTRHLLSLQAPTFGSKLNFNHGPGVPLMLAQTPVDSRFGVYEFAVDLPNVTLRKAKILHPHVATITCIHPDHLMYYGTLEALSDQKCLLFDVLEPGGTAVLNRDNRFFQRQLDNARSKGVANVLTFGKAPDSDFRLIEADLSAEGSRATVSVFGEREQFEISYAGEYMLMNCLAALATVHALGGDWREAVAQMSTLPQLTQRNEHYVLDLGRGTAELIDDTFSANPGSVRAGLSVLELTNPPSGGRRIAVLGEIAELGDESAKFHAELAPAVKDAGVDLLYTVGADLTDLREELGSAVPGLHSRNPAKIAKAVAKVLSPGDIVWVKGSRRSPADLERILGAIKSAAKTVQKSASPGPRAAADPKMIPKTRYQGPLRPRVAKAGKNGARLEILLLGDTGFGENYQKELERAGRENILKTRGYDAPLSGMRDLLVSADLVVANLETPITDIERSPLAGKKPYVHWGDVNKTPTHLLSHNIDVVTLANNHTFDYGGAGFDQTLAVLEARGLTAVGGGADLEAAGQPLIVKADVDGRQLTLAMIAAYKGRDQAWGSPFATAERGGLNPLDPASMGPRIARIRDEHPDAFVIVLPHWGANYKWRGKTQRMLAVELLSAGADLIVGHGAHMIQEIEKRRKRWIVYSLGNFMFNSPGRYARYEAPPYSFVGRLVLEPEGRRGLTKRLQLLPIVSDNRLTDYNPRFVTQAEFDDVKSLLDRRPQTRPLEPELTHARRDAEGRFFFEIVL
jgi:UDP-N-acetylmuramoyl-tripeptide--D-alanyl-D-alanine ligase